MKNDRPKSRAKRERPTVGQLIYKNLQDAPERYDPREIQRAAQEKICSSLQECVDINRRKWKHFYIVYLLRHEQLLPGALRGFFIARQSRPSPDWDMSLWEYFTDDEKLVYHWTLPDQITGRMMLANPSAVPDHAKELLGYVTQFSKSLLT